MENSNARTARTLSALVLLLAPMLAAAQGYPAKTVRIIVPSPAGGLNDGLSRALAQEMTKVWGQQVIVENRPGANQIIAAETLARSAPDGYNILVTDKASIVLNPLLRAKLPYDPVKDFAPVMALAHVSNVLIGSAGLPAKSLQELVAMAKAKPGEINYGSFGLGSTSHLDTEAFSGRAGIKMNHIPYKGVADVVQAVVSGQVHIALAGMPVVPPLLREGRIKALAIGNPQRSPLLPEVPTFAEAGFPDFASQSWFGMFVRAGTPRAIIDKIAADVGRVIAVKDFSDKFVTGVGLDLLNQGPEQFSRVIDADRARYAAYVKTVNIKLD